MDDDTLRIDSTLEIPRAELRFRFSQSSGPGGQHVQKSATRVELLFDVLNSPSLSEAQRARVLDRLSSYIDGGGLLHLVAQSERSQWRNRQEAVERFQVLMRKGLRRRRARRATRPTATSRELRLREKRKRGVTKVLRREVRDDE